MSGKQPEDRDEPVEGQPQQSAADTSSGTLVSTHNRPFGHSRSGPTSANATVNGPQGLAAAVTNDGRRSPEGNEDAPVTVSPSSSAGAAAVGDGLDELHVESLRTSAAERSSPDEARANANAAAPEAAASVTGDEPGTRETDGMRNDDDDEAVRGGTTRVALPPITMPPSSLKHSRVKSVLTPLDGTAGRTTRQHTASLLLPGNTVATPIRPPDEVGPSFESALRGTGGLAAGNSTVTIRSDAPSATAVGGAHHSRQPSRVGFDEDRPALYRDFIRHVRTASRRRLEDDFDDEDGADEAKRKLAARLGGTDGEAVAGAAMRSPTRRRSHHRRFSSYMSADPDGEKERAAAVTRSANFPVSDFRRGRYAGAVTVLSEQVLSDNKRVFVPDEVHVAVGDTVLFRWFGHHQLVQVDCDGVPVDGGLGSDDSARKHGELPIIFDVEGQYWFESLNHPGSLKAMVRVRPRRYRMVATLGRIAASMAFFSVLVAVITLALVFFIKSRYLVAPEAPEDGGDDGKSQWRAMEDVVKDTFIPWAIAGLLVLLVLIVARLVMFCVPVYLSDFGRGFAEMQQRSWQGVSGFVGATLLGLIIAMWIVGLQFNFGFAVLVGEILSHFAGLINQAVSMIADIRFLIDSAPNAIDAPESALDMLDQVESAAEGMRQWTTSGEELVRAVLRVLAVLLFVSLQLYLFSVSTVITGAWRRRASTMKLSFWLGVISVVAMCYTIGVVSLVEDLLDRTYQIAQLFADQSLTVERAVELSGVSQNSGFVNFLLSCSSTGTLSVDYIDERVQEAVVRWNVEAPIELQLAQNNANATSVQLLGEYMDLVVFQVQQIESQLVTNTSFLSYSLEREFSTVLLPSVQAGLRITRTVLTLVDCRILRNVMAKVVPVLENSVLNPIRDLLYLLYTAFAMLVVSVCVCRGAAHVFDRPYKLWFEAQTERWFRFRCAFLAHRRLLMAAENVASPLTNGNNGPPKPGHSRTSSGWSRSRIPSELEQFALTQDNLKKMQKDAKRKTPPPTEAAAAQNTSSAQTTPPPPLPQRRLAAMSGTIVDHGVAAEANTLAVEDVDVEMSAEKLPTTYTKPANGDEMHPSAAPAAEQVAFEQALAARDAGVVSDDDDGSVVVHSAHDDGDASPIIPGVAGGPLQPGAGLEGIALDEAAYTVDILDALDGTDRASARYRRITPNHQRLPTGSSVGGGAATLTGGGATVGPVIPSSGLSSDGNASGVTWSDAASNTTDTDEAVPLVPWHSPPKCTKPALISGFYQMTLLSGAMLLFQAGLLIAFHRSYSHNQLPSLMVIAAFLCIVVPLVQIAIDYLENLYARAVLRMAALLACIATSAIFIMIATTSFIHSDKCAAERAEDRAAGNLTLTTATGECGVDETIQAAERGVYATVISVVCVIALVTNAVMMVFVRHRVGDFIGSLFQDVREPVKLTKKAVRRRLAEFERQSVVLRSSTSNPIRALEDTDGQERSETLFSPTQRDGGADDGGHGAAVALTVMPDARASGSVSDTPKQLDDVELDLGSPWQRTSQVRTSMATTADSSDQPVTFEVLDQMRRLRLERLRLLRRVGTAVAIAAFAATITALLVLFILEPSLQNDESFDDPFARSNRGCNGFDQFCDRRVDEIVWLNTHNGFSSLDRDFIGPNHYFGIERQLRDGVRSFMLDIHNATDPATGEMKAYLCHGDCRAGSLPLKESLDLIGDFLAQRPRDVIMLLIEQYPDDALVHEAVAASSLAPLLWTGPADADGMPRTQGDRFTWPTLSDFIQMNQRVLWFTDVRPFGYLNYPGEKFNGLVGDPDRRSFAPYMLYMWDFFFETPFSASTVEEFSCNVSVRYDPNATMNGRMSILNHFLTILVGAPFLAQNANAESVIRSHFFGCQGQWGALPNLLSVDFYTIGETLAIANALNRESGALDP